jgi:pilus assembly protein Flp/PilA
MFSLINRFIRNKDGSTAIEYGLIAALISVGLIAGATAIGNSNITKMKQISDALDNSGTP